jgi:transposase
MLTRPDRLTDKQRQLRDDPSAACPEMIDLAELISSFADLLHPRQGNHARLDNSITTTRAFDLPHLHPFTRGLDLDRAAVDAGPTLPHHNGRTQGVNTTTKRIMQQMHGRASPDPLHHHILPGQPGHAPSPLSRPGARCRDCSRSVSPDLSPNRTCTSRRIRLSTVSVVRR